MAASPLIQTRAGGLIGIAGKSTLGLGLTTELPDDLLEAAVKRIQRVAMLIGVLAGSSVIGNTILFYFFDALAPLPATAVVVRLIGVLDAALMVAVARSPRISRKLTCDIGLSFEIWAAYVISSTELIMLIEVGITPGTISSVVIWMMLFRLVIPATPIKAAVTSLLSAAMIIPAVYTAEMATKTTLPPAAAWGQVATATLAAMLAILASRWVYKMGTAVHAARQMGAYKLERRLGAGGMGEVWEASHRMLKRPAAIKLIRPERIGPSDTAGAQATLHRFEQEAQVTATLSSPHTVQLYDFGVTSDGAFYYVMELLQGLDLETLIEHHGPIPAERAVHFLKQACHSLADAHEVGLTHRDIKPANIFVCRLGREYDWVKVLDFGLVKLADEVQSDALKLTQEGLAAGTPAYMAPELSGVGGAEVGPRTDLYMLGCVGYWLLTGALVFDGQSAIEMISAHIHSTPVRPSARTEIPIPPALDDLIIKCLAKKPEDRPQSALELLNSLEQLENRDAWTQVRAQRWWQRHRPAIHSSPPSATLETEPA